MYHFSCFTEVDEEADRLAKLGMDIEAFFKGAK